MATIIQRPDAISMCGNMKKFIVASHASISFQLKENETVLLDASYEPGMDGRVTIDLKDIVESRLSFTLSHADFYQQATIAKAFTAQIDTTTVTFTAVRSGVDNLADTPANWLRDNFLTWQPTSKSLTYYSPEWLTYYAVQPGTLKLKAYFADAPDQTITLGSMTAGSAYTANLQYAVIAGKLGQTYPTHFDVWAESSGGTRLTYIQRYLYSEINSEDERWYLFENSLGGIDTLRAYGNTDFNGEHKHQIAGSDGKSTEYRVDSKRIFNQNTGHLSVYERHWLLDFFPARKKYIHAQSSFREIVLTDSDAKYTSSGIVSDFSFKFRFADDSAGHLLNLIRNENDIPDAIVIPNIQSPDFRLPPRLSEYPRVTLSEGVILPAFDPHSDKPKITTVGALIAAAVAEALGAIPGGDGTPGAGGQLVNIIKENALSSGTDNDVFSSLRTKKEIELAIQNFADSIDDYLGNLDEKYLSKINPDTAAEVITFVKGIISQAVIKTTELEATGNITSLATVQAQIIKALISAEIQNMILKGTLSSESFTSGFLGNGFRLTYSDSRWILEVDKIVVRQAMEIFELIVQKTTHQGGQVIHSPFGGKLTAVAHGGTYWRCEHDSADDCIEGAFILCQNFKIGSGNQNPTGQTTFQGVSVKRYWRKVTSAGRGWFNLSVSTAESGSDMPQVGDDVSVLGHESNPDWQNAIMLASTGGNTPYIAHYAGINTFSLVGKEVVREGNLSGIVDAVFGSLSGYGLYSNNVFLRGIFKLANGDDVGSTLEQLQTEVSAVPGQIDLAVRSVPLGLTNLLRNYEGAILNDDGTAKFWEAGATLIEDDGTAVKPYVVSITLPQNVYNGVQGSTITPDNQITLNLSNGTTRNTTIAWGTINTGTLGTFTVNSTNYTIPADIDQSPKPTASITVNVTAAPVVLTITSVVQPAPVSVERYGTPTLPSTVTLNISDGSTRNVPVSWSSYNTNTIGSYTLTGSYTIPAGIESTPKPAVSLTLNVVAQTLTIVSVVQPSPVSVVQFGTPTLPSVVTLNISDGSTRNVPVSWSSYNTNTIGTFTLTGLYNLPSGVSGSKPAVTLTLNVTSAAGIIDLMPIMVGRTDLFSTGSDGTGNYVQPKSQTIDWNLFNAKLPDIIVGTSKLYVRYAWGSDAIGTNIRMRSGGSFIGTGMQLVSGSSKLSESITVGGADQFGMYLGGTTIKIYNLEMRNDGNSPAWW